MGGKTPEKVKKRFYQLRESAFKSQFNNFDTGVYYKEGSRGDSMIGFITEEKKISFNDATQTISIAVESTQTFTAENNQLEVESSTHFSKIDYETAAQPIE